MALADSDKSSNSNDGSKHDPSAATSASATVTEIALASAEGGKLGPCAIIDDTDVVVESYSEPTTSPNAMENIIAISTDLSATANNPSGNIASATAEKPPSTIKKKATVSKSKKIIKDAEEKIKKKQPKAKKTKLGVDGPTAADVVGSQQQQRQQQQQQQQQPQGEVMTKKKNNLNKEKTFKGGDKSAINANRKMPKLPMAASKKRKDKMSSSAISGIGGGKGADETGSGGGGIRQNSQQRSNYGNTTTTYSAQQAAVNDMMRRAFEEDQYSALGSIVDTDSSDEDDDDHHHHHGRNKNDNGIGDDDDNYEGGSSSFRFNHRPKRGSSSSSSSGLDAVTSSGGKQVASSWMEANHFNDRKMDRKTLMIAMRRHLRIEGTKTVRNFDKETFLEDAENYLNDASGNNRGSARKRSMTRGVSPVPRLENDGFGATGDHVMIPEEDLAADGRRIGKRRKKKRRGKTASSSIQQTEHYASGGAAAESFGSNGTSSGVDASMAGSGNDEEDVWENNNHNYSGGTDANHNGHDDDLIEEEEEEEEEEISIFGQTTGASNATWVECDRCKKWRRLRGVVDARKLPTRWFCSMNKNDPNRARCSAPEEEYDSSTTPESAMDQRTRKHLRVWVRRLHCNEAYENRQRSSKKRAAAALLSMTAKEPYEWIRCCNPACGKWRMLLRSMDASSIIDKCNEGEWYCVMNTWDEKAASCGAAQENLPSVGCPPWVLVDAED